MRGAYRIVISNQFLKYDFTIRRNFTVVRGDSATGKTTLIEMVRQWIDNDDSGIEVACDRPLRVLSGRNWEQDLESITSSIVFIDEQSRFVKSVDFAERAEKSDNYYVLITREKLENLPISVTEIYGIRNSGRYSNLRQEFTENEFYRIYGVEPHHDFAVGKIITEDSNSGYEYWKKLAEMRKAECAATGGKSSVLKLLKSEKLGNVLAVVDGAAFGSNIEEVLQYIKYLRPNTEVYAPESFEFLVLSSGLIDYKDLEKILKNPENYIASEEYPSWERYFTDLLMKATANTQMSYSKKNLNDFYLSKRNVDKIAEQIPNVLHIGE